MTLSGAETVQERPLLSRMQSRYIYLVLPCSVTVCALTQVDESSEASYGCAVPVDVYERPRVAPPAATQPRPRHRYVIV